jgi:Domain of unknown function (DUF4136)
MNDSSRPLRTTRCVRTPGATGHDTARWTAIVVLSALSVFGGIAACTSSGPSQPESMRDPQANFASYQTFGWTAGGDVAPNDEPVKLLDSNIRAAITAELKRRGYVEAAADATPDLRIAYETASADKIENNPVRVGIGVGNWGGNVGGSVNVGSPSIRNYKEGTLVIHAIDSARNAEVWQGRVSQKVTKGSLEPAAVNLAVATAMKDFPARQ